MSTRLGNTMAAHACIKKDRRTSNKEKEMAIRTITSKRRVKRMVRRMKIR